jgi:Lar family restriction alleviation protein
VTTPNDLLELATWRNGLQPGDKVSLGCKPFVPDAIWTVVKRAGFVAGYVPLITVAEGEVPDASLHNIETVPLYCLYPPGAVPQEASNRVLEKPEAKTPAAELRPCPFCDGDAHMDYVPLAESDEVHYFVVCGSCGVEGPWDNTEAGARRWWNSRTTDKQIARLTGLLKRLRKAAYEQVQVNDPMSHLTRQESARIMDDYVDVMQATVEYAHNLKPKEDAQ